MSDKHVCFSERNRHETTHQNTCCLGTSLICRSRRVVCFDLLMGESHSICDRDVGVARDNSVEQLCVLHARRMFNAIRPGLQANTASAESANAFIEPTHRTHFLLTLHHRGTKKQLAPTLASRSRRSTGMCPGPLVAISRGGRSSSNEEAPVLEPAINTCSGILVTAPIGFKLNVGGSPLLRSFHSGGACTTCPHPPPTL